MTDNEEYLDRFFDPSFYQTEKGKTEPSHKRTGREIADEVVSASSRHKTTPFSLEELQYYLDEIRYNNQNQEEMYGIKVDRDGLALMEAATQILIDKSGKGYREGMDYDEAYQLASANRIFDASEEPLPLENPDYFLIFGIGPAPHMKEEIDNIYDANPDVYYSHYRRSRHSKDNYRYFYPTEQLMLIEKMAGITVYARETGDQAPIKRLLNKGYKRLYRYITKTDVLRYRDIQSIWEKDRGRYEQISDTMAYHRFVQVVLALITASGKETEGMFRFYDDFFEVEEAVDHWDLEQMIMKNRSRFEIMASDETVKAIIDEFRQKFFHDGHVMNGVNRIIDHERELIRKRLPHDQRFFLDYELRFKNPTVVNIQKAKDDFSNFGFPPRFFDRSLSSDELTYFFQTYYWSRGKGNFDKDATPEEKRDVLLENLVPNVYMYVLARDFFDTRMKYLKGIDQSNATELALIQEQEAANRHVLEKELADSRAETKQLAKRFNALEIKETALHREVKRLEQEREKAEEKEKAAQERIQFLEVALTAQDVSDDLSDDTSVLDKKHIIILAGHVDWHKKLQASHPDWEIVDAEQLLTRDLAFLDNTEALVFYNTRHTGHSAYYRVKAAMTKYNQTLYPIGESHNVALTLKEMASAVARFNL